MTATLRHHLAASAALKAGAKLTVRARVKEIAVGSDGRATGVVYFGRRDCACG